jgi:hypothetical protein
MLMKNKMIYLFLLTPFISFSQLQPMDTIPIPMKSGKVFYEKEYTLSGNQKKDQLFERAVKWFSDSFQELKEPLITADKDAGKIVGHGIFKIIVSKSGNYYWIKPVVSITVADGRYLFQSYDYYEKPIEKGISNEYSKIEYRWRDYRKGKPWSKEDLPLFKGLHENSQMLMTSLQQSMSR